MPRALLAAALVLGATACAPRVPGRDRARLDALEVEGHRFYVQYQPEDAEAAALVAEAVREGVPRLARFVRLRVPVTITVHPTRESLEAVVGGYYWLRAWAGWASIELLSPRAWGTPGIEPAEAPEPARLRQLVLHELTHCAMFQATASDWTFDKKDVPTWFREGMASVLADEGPRRLGVRAVWSFYARAQGRRSAGEPRSGGDPLSDPEPLLAEESELVYGTAHLAFEFLVRRYGDARVRDLVSRMGEGAFFATAFRKAVGIAPEAFEADFRRYVVWRGWER